MRLKQSILLQFILLLLCTLSAVLAYFYLYQYLPAERKLHREALYARAKAAFDVSLRPLERALGTSDDLALLSQVENIMKIDDVRAAYILDRGGRVLTHNSTSEWNKTYTDPVSRNAVKAQTLLLQRGGEDKEYVFSAPLGSSATLCLGLSSRKIDEAVSLASRTALYSALIVMVLAAALFLFFLYYGIGGRFRKMKDLLQSHALGGGTLPDGGADELGELSRLINEVLIKSEAERTAATSRAGEAGRKLSRVLAELTKSVDGGAVVLDSENRILCANIKAKDFLFPHEQEPAGKHVLEVVRYPELISLLQKAALNPGKMHQGNFDGVPIRAISSTWDASGGISGTIILI
ncbi:MAG: hypothetical protein ACYC5N_11055 [Endomicrobiales bacterium]